VPTAKRRMFSWQDGSRTNSIIRRHGHPREVATSARWNLRMQGRYKAVAIDISGSGSHPCPTSPHLHGGNTWLWDNLSFTGEHGWINEAISDGSLLAVTDGSFLREHYPNLCSAAFVLECTRG
jgi:hypothetical protein